MDHTGTYKSLLKTDIMLKINVLFLVFLSCFASAVQAQFYRDTSIHVYHGSVQLKNAWAGGFNSPVFAEMDVNNDGIMDLLSFDSNTARLGAYVNKGTLNTVDYYYAPEYTVNFPKALEGWIRTYDYDCDGDMDLFSYYNGSISVYRNDINFTGYLSFYLVVDELESYYGTFPSNIFVSRVNIPAFTDTDGDGDMDVLSLSIAGSYIEHHKNLSMDSSGVCGLHHFYIPQCWGYFALSGLSNTAVMPPVPFCPLWPANPFREFSQTEVNSVNQKTTMHAGSALWALDMDGDGDKDILNGDILSPNLLYVQNCGTPDSAWICAQDSQFPSYDIPGNMNDVAGPYYFDVDNDGNKDLLVANFFTGEDFYNVKYYRNTTNNLTNIFSYQTNRFLGNEMIDLGTGAHPTFTDIDGDGLQDLIVANNFLYNNNQPVAKLAYYRNTGTALKAEFSKVSDDFAGISTLNLLELHPAFGDMDGDGDDDMLLGEAGGTLLLFTNASGNFNLAQTSYQSIGIGANAAPQIIDIDKDGLLDLLIGERNGNLNYYRNNGTAANPVFSLITSNFGGVDVRKVNSFYGYSTPLLFSNSGGQFELLVGSESGYIYHYTNITGNLSGSFTLADSAFEGITEKSRASLAMHDVDGDGRYDLVIGNESGGMVLYTQNTILNVVENGQGPYFELYPNPASEMLNIKVNGNNQTELEIYDITGRICMRESSFRGHVVDISSLRPGSYLCRVLDGHRSFSRKFIKQ